MGEGGSYLWAPELTYFIGCYRLIDWISDHRFPSIVYPGSTRNGNTMEVSSSET